MSWKCFPTCFRSKLAADVTENVSGTKFAQMEMQQPGELLFSHVAGNKSMCTWSVMVLTPTRTLHCLAMSVHRPSRPAARHSGHIPCAR